MPFTQAKLAYRGHSDGRLAGGIQSVVAVRDWMVECVGSLHVLQIMWMAHPNQADRPQGTHRVSDGLLVAQRRM